MWFLALHLSTEKSERPNENLDLEENMVFIKISRCPSEKD